MESTRLQSIEVTQVLNIKDFCKVWLIKKQLVIYWLAMSLHY